ncbi:MAG: hypothetical protein AAB350_00420 [Patescibacteria group bacterium]
MENSNNKKLVFIGGILVVVALFFIFKNISLAPVVEDQKAEKEVSKITIDPNIPGQTLPLSNDPKNVAWDFFQKYLAFNKNHNLEGVKSVVYKVALICEDPKTYIDCEARMGSAYSYGSALKKEDFTNVWSDEKQTILATDFKIQEDDSVIGRNRAIIFFIKDEADNLKMLSFSPFKGAVTSKGVASKEELDYRIIRYTEDKDEDGIADYQEECLGVKEGEICLPTNPKIRDTDGDGLWDGVEALMQ